MDLECDKFSTAPQTGCGLSDISNEDNMDTSSDLGTPNSAVLAVLKAVMGWLFADETVAKQKDSAAREERDVDTSNDSSSEDRDIDARNTAQPKLDRSPSGSDSEETMDTSSKPNPEVCSFRTGEIDEYEIANMDTSLLKGLSFCTVIFQKPGH